MNIVVLVKQVPDMNAVKVDRASGRPVLSGQMVVSSFDEYGIEEAIQLRDKHGGEITVICAGPASAKDAVTRALAMGADKGIHLQIADTAGVDTLALATALAEQIRGLNPDVVLAGQNSDDYETGHVGPQIAELLGLPLISSALKVDVNGSHLVAERDTEDGRQTVELDLPVMLLAMTGLNEPRYPSLKGIMAAKKKPVDLVPLEVTPVPGRVTWGEPFVPERTVQGVIVQDAPPAEAARQLVDWLQGQKLI